MTFRLILVAGDSNAVHFGSNPSTLPAGIAPSAFMFQAGGSYWGALTPGVNTGGPNTPTAWGPETPLVHYLNQLFPGDTFGIIKVAQGSTTVAQDATLTDWSPNSTGELFDLTASTIANARAAFVAAQGSPAPEVSAVVWIDGPNAASSAAKAASFEADTTGFFAAVRDEWMHDAAGKIISTRMTDAPSLTYNQAVREAQWRIDQADINNVSIKTIGMGVQADGFHYTAAGEVSIGQAAATIFDGWF